MTYLTKLSLANRSIVALVAIAVIAFGVYAATALKQELIPSLTLPAVTITSTYAGASPEIVDRDVTEPIEDAIGGGEGQTGTTSYSSEGVSIVQIEYDFGADTDAAVQELRQQISEAQSRLPEDVSPTVAAGSSDDLPIITLAASSSGDEQGLAQDLENIVKPELASVAGVNEVSVTGVRDRIVSITPDVEKLEENGLTAESITTVLQSGGAAIPAGDVSRDGESLSVRVGDVYNSVGELENLYVTTSPDAASATTISQAVPTAGTAVTPETGGAVSAAASASAAPTATSTAQPEAERASEAVRLGSVADVEVALEESSSVTRTNGEPSLGISVTKSQDGNTVDISDGIRGKIPDLESGLGDGAELAVVSDDAPSIRQSIEGLTTEGLLGLAFAVLVILVFLLSLRSTLVTAVSIPLSVLIALIVLWAWDYSLNILTLSALTIAVGRVVDDSIVVLENIKRHLEYGEEKFKAIMSAVREVAGAVTASTLTTVAVFLPIAFTGSLTGELFAPFSITVTVALLASLLVSLTVVPVLAYWFLKVPSVGRGPEEVREEVLAREHRGILQRAYVPVILWATRHRVVTLALAFVVFAGSMSLVPRLETDFLGDSGQNTFSVEQELPAGTSLAATDEAAKKVEAAIEDVDGVESYQVTVGSGETAAFAPPGGGGASGSNSATFSVVADENAEGSVIERELDEAVSRVEDAGNVTVSVSDMAVGNAGLEVIVQASDEDVLREAASRVEKAVAGTPDTAQIASNLTDGETGISVRVDGRAAAEEGLTEIQIGQAVSAATQGQSAAEVDLDGERRDVFVRTGSGYDTPEGLRDLEVSTASGSVRLDEVADVVEVEVPTQVTRVDGERSASITATATGEDTGVVGTQMQQRLEDLDLPEGASYSIGGVTADQGEAFGSLGIALAAAIVLVYIVMVGTFRSIVRPVILLVSIPFAATGAVVLLLLTDTALGVAALIGMLMLIGIVVTNAIVLMDLIQQYRDRGMGAREAVIEGGRRRLRPILMTAVATVCALTPMALGLTASSGFISQPLAVVVIGGLTTSTVLTLVLVPVLYTIVEGLKDRSKKRRERRRARRENRLLEPSDAPDDANGHKPQAPTEDAETGPISRRERRPAKRRGRGTPPE